MKGFHLNIELKTLKSNNFREVVYTSKYIQLVLMVLKPREEIGLEIHKDNDKFLRFES